MINKRIFNLALMAILLSGCNSVSKVISHAGFETAPDDFIIEQDTTDVVSELSELTGYDHQVFFKRKQHVIPQAEKARLLSWLESAQPPMIGVRGTGGAERHRELGYRRAAEIIAFLQSQQVSIDTVLLDYDASLMGGQGLVTIIPATLARELKENAPILVISSN